VPFPHRPDGGGSSGLWNVGRIVPNYTALQPRRQPSSWCFLITWTIMSSRKTVYVKILVYRFCACLTALYGYCPIFSHTKREIGEVNAYIFLGRKKLEYLKYTTSSFSFLVTCNAWLNFVGNIWIFCVWYRFHIKLLQISFLHDLPLKDHNGFQDGTKVERFKERWAITLSRWQNGAVWNCPLTRQPQGNMLYLKAFN
jgi:hypothetical protein